MKEDLRPEPINGNAWEEEFLKKFKERRAARRLASGFVLNGQGAWVATYTTDNEFNYNERTDLIDDNFHAGVLSEETPQSISSISGRAVFTDRSLNSTPRSDYRPVVDGLKYISTQKPQYHSSGSSYSGFSLKAGDIIVEDKDASGSIKGWYVYPAGSFNSNEITYKKFSWEVVTDKVWHQIVQGDDKGGRVNLEVGNVFHGGAGDDLIVTYKNSVVNYGSYEDSIPGAFLSGGAGDDTLLGAEGADYLVSGSGEDWLYGESGSDTYIVESHAGATTIIADIVSPIFRRPEVGATGWQDEFGIVDTDTVILPKGVALDQLQLAWGAALIEAVNIELAPKLSRGTYRNPPRGQMLYSTLDISWGKDQKVRIVLPNPSDFNGSGVELIKFADGASVSLEELIESSELVSAPDVYRHGVLINNYLVVNSSRDNKILPLVGGRGDDTLIGAGELRGMRGNDLISGGAGNDVLWGGPGNDTLSGGAGNDLYKYDGLGIDVVVNTGGGIDGIDFSEFGVSINQLKFHRDNDDMVIVVNYGASPKIRIFNHFGGGDPSISFVRVQGEDRGAKDYTANQIIELLHDLPPLRDVEDILLRNDEAAMQAMLEIIKFYQLQG